MCTRGFREILRSGKLAARFRSGVSRAVIARMLPGMPGDRIQADYDSEIRRLACGTATFSAGRRAAQIEFARDHVARRKNNGRYASNRSSTKVGVDLWGLGHLFAPCVRRNNSLEVRRERRQKADMFVLSSP